jgi:hypothetical protein
MMNSHGCSLKASKLRTQNLLKRFHDLALPTVPLVLFSMHVGIVSQPEAQAAVGIRAVLPKAQGGDLLLSQARAGGDLLRVFRFSV